MTLSQLLDSTNTQYREMVQIGTWVTTSNSDTGGATFIAESDKEPLGRRPCNWCNKIHFGPREKPHWERVATATKKIEGKTWYYCKRCDRWDPTHLTTNHRTCAITTATDKFQANEVRNATGDDASFLGTDDRSIGGSALCFLLHA